MLGGQNFEKLVFKPLKVGSNKLKDFHPGLATKGNPLPFLNVLHLEQEKENHSGRRRVQECYKNLQRSDEDPTTQMKLRRSYIYKVEAYNLKTSKMKPKT